VVFLERLRAARRRNASLLCLGLDPLPERLPSGLDGDVADAVLAFNRAIVEATADLVCAYKPNAAFYEALGPRGWWALHETVRAVPRDVPVVVDAKRGDIGPSAERYAAAVFDKMGAAACTVSPYMGWDSVEPFTRGERFAFVLCHTSNPGAAEFQELEVVAEGRSMPLYEAVARRAAQWERAAQCGLVAGATYPATLARIAACAPELTLLVPGLGTQGGEARAVLGALGPGARQRVLLNVSRQILYADRAPGESFAAASRRAALTWRATLAAAGESAMDEESQGQEQEQRQEGPRQEQGHHAGR
jgi:orotidine 5'-phosphate decarboxylase subfamily 2